MTQPTKSSLRPFFVLWGGQAVSLFGSQIVQFALIWWLTATTGSATVLATASLVGLLPQVVLGPFVGVLVDRWNRRLTMLVADSVVAAASLILAVLFFNGAVQIWHVYLIMFIRSLGGGFHFAAISSSTSLMVPKEHLSRVQGFNQMLNGGVNVAAAPLGALLLSILSFGGILMIDVITALFAIVPLFFIAVPQPEGKAEAAAQPSTILQDLKEGFRYVWNWPGLMILMVMAMVINFLFNPAAALTPILVSQDFNGGAVQLGWVESAFGIGIILGGLGLGIWGGFQRRMLTSALGALVMGLSVVLIGIIPGTLFGGLIALFLFMGLSNPFINGPIFAIFQAKVAPDMQGRVFSLIGSLATLMAPLGLAIAGPVADLIGVRSWFIVAGFSSLILAVVIVLTPTLLRLDQEEETASTPGQDPAAAAS